MPPGSLLVTHWWSMLTLVGVVLLACLICVQTSSSAYFNQWTEFHRLTLRLVNYRRHSPPHAWTCPYLCTPAKPRGISQKKCDNNVQYCTTFQWFEHCERTAMINFNIATWEIKVYHCHRWEEPMGQEVREAMSLPCIDGYRQRQFWIKPPQ